MANNDVPASILRDIFFLWFYATITCMEAIQNRATSQDDLTNQLKSFIDTSRSENQQAIQVVYAAVFNNAEFGTVKQSLMSIPALSTPWSGAGPHPALAELNSIFIPQS